MTKDQSKELFRAWSLYAFRKQKAILLEYLEAGGDVSCKDDFLSYLKDKREFEGQRQMVALI